MPVASDMLYPQKRREIQNHHMDSTVWNGFPFRHDDIVIASYAKSGTTWLQQIVGQLIFAGSAGVNVAELSPWLDLRVPPAPTKLAFVETQRHRRFLKTHLPVDALVFSPDAKYLYVARDGRDVVWSLYNHHLKANEAWYDALNNSPGRVGPPIDPPPDDIRTYFNRWLADDGYPFWPFWENVRSWWEVRNLPNVMLVHFADLKADLPGQIDRIADYLGIALANAAMARVLKHCGFDYMKAHAENAAPLGGLFWEGGAQTFIHKGTNGRWRDVLSAEESAAYARIASNELGDECAGWLQNGNMTR